MTEINIKIEKSKALIQVAQILIILAGFLFTASGLAYTNSLNSLSDSYSSMSQLIPNLIKPDINLSVQQEVILNSYLNATIKNIELVKPQLDLILIFFIGGVIFTIVAIILGIKGYYLIGK